MIDFLITPCAWVYVYTSIQVVVTGHLLSLLDAGNTLLDPSSNALGLTYSMHSTLPSQKAVAE